MLFNAKPIYPGLALLVILVLSACKPSLPPAPMCRQESNHTENRADFSSCLIVVDQLLLVLEDKGSGKFFLPGGHINGTESAQCGAHRHTWQLSGLNPLVSQELGSVGAHKVVFLCDLQNGFDGSMRRIVPPPWVDSSIGSIQLRNPFILTPQQWHNYEEFIQIRRLFNTANRSVSDT